MKKTRAWIILPQNRATLSWPIYRTKREAQHTLDVYGLGDFRIVPVDITFNP